MIHRDDQGDPRAHPFASGDSASRFHVSADHLPPDDAMRDQAISPGLLVALAMALGALIGLALWLIVWTVLHIDWHRLSEGL